MIKKKNTDVDICYKVFHETIECANFRHDFAGLIILFLCHHHGKVYRSLSMPFVECLSRTRNQIIYFFRALELQDYSF